MGKLFGTDGIRGVANRELTCELALNVGRAAAVVLTDDTHMRPKVLIGKDTRISSDMLECALASGLCSVGADVMLLGVVPTPAVAYLVRKYNFDAGIMISASHNPCEFNGIKIFKNDGYKLSDEKENQIEAYLLDPSKLPAAKNGDQVGRVTVCEKAVRDYINYLKSTISTRFEGLKVALDCANGSASASASILFQELGAECRVLSDTPDGVNINQDCGSTHMGKLRDYVVEHHMDIGLAFDGDADRLLAVDENGKIIDGDKLIAIIAKDLKEQGRLAENTAVVTVMSNMGFFKFCEQEGIKAEITSVGDRYVLENMVKNNYDIGGEQSGHIIFHEYATTGDGQLSALQLLDALVRSGKKASELASVMEVYPQVLINVRVTNEGKARYDGDEVISTAIRNAEESLQGDGRILVRMSGTEPLIRVMLEGKDYEQINNLAKSVANVVKERLA